MVNGAEVSADDLTVDSNVTYRARDRYRHVSGDLVRTCREDQLWTGEQPVFEGNGFLYYTGFAVNVTNTVITMNYLP